MDKSVVKRAQIGGINEKLSKSRVINSGAIKRRGRLWKFGSSCSGMNFWTRASPHKTHL